MSEYIKTTEFESNKDNIAEKLGLPSGFITEKGSVYQYNPDGSVHRDKFDGTQSDAGIAVFAEDTLRNRSVIGVLGLEQDHVPLEMKRFLYIIQAKTDYTGALEEIYKASELKGPHDIAIGVVSGRGKIIDRIPVSILPHVGEYVFEMDKLPDGRPVRHPGHKVVEIIR